MFEIPLNLRYNFIVKQKSTLYATTGFSSYLMNKEFYTYSYLYNGVYGERGYTYNHSSKNWFSILNLGAGYERSLGKKTLFKIEPYFKIPLGGVGMGKLPISSAGIYVGFSRKLK